MNKRNSANNVIGAGGNYSAAPFQGSSKKSIAPSKASTRNVVTQKQSTNSVFSNFLW